MTNSRLRSKSPPAPQQAQLFLGIECGGTRSVAMVVDARDRCLQRIEVKAPGNLRLLRETELLWMLEHIANQFPRPAAVGLGMAGVLDEADRRRVRAAAARIWQGIPCWAGNDLETALAAANDPTAPAKVARVVVISGTGASCYAKKADGGEVLTGGWGHILGDRGSGYEMVTSALRTVFLRYDESGRWPALGARFLRLLELKDPGELISWVSAANKSAIAALAIELFEAAADGDDIASRTLEESAEWLARAAIACAHRVAQKNDVVDFVLTGSILQQQDSFARDVELRLKRSWPRAAVRLLPREGAWGAAHLAHELIKTLPSTPPPVSQVVPVLPQPAPAPSPSGIIPETRGPSPTEQRHALSRELHKMPIPEAIRLMLSEDSTLPTALLKEEKKITRAIELIVRSLRRGGRLFYVGAGTSGRLGALDAYECPPTFSVSPEMIQSIVAGGEKALTGAMEDAEDDFAVGAQTVRSRGISSRDVVVGIAASGRTPFVWGALHAARALGATTILVCFNPNLAFKRGARPTLVIAPSIGPEILTGSTRLKAGTATKLLLNIFSTLAMVQMGKVIENLMVDVRPTNSKLRERATQIVRELTGAEWHTAQEALKQNDWSVRKALSNLKANGGLLPVPSKPNHHHALQMA